MWLIDLAMLQTVFSLDLFHPIPEKYGSYFYHPALPHDLLRVSYN